MIHPTNILQPTRETRPVAGINTGGTGRVAGQGMVLASPAWTAYVILCEFDGPKQSLNLSKIGYGFTIVVFRAYTEFNNPSSETWVSKILENYVEQRSV